MPHRRVFLATLALLSVLAACDRIDLRPVEANAQIQAPDLSPNLGWLNTDRPLEFDDELKGHVVLLDFWTYCCINCIHVLPDLEYLEAKYKDQPFIVIGVHSAKFTAEGERRGIRNAMLRYDIKHPVVIDDEMAIWDRYGARAWPSFVVVDPEGVTVGIIGGEGHRDTLDRVIAEQLEIHREKGTLADEPFRPRLEEGLDSATGLRFPGKVAGHPPANGEPGYLFTADSTNHRVVISSWPDALGRSEVIEVFGGVRGFADGGPIGAATPARFDDPQGFAYDHEARTLYVADRANHLIRAIDLSRNTVTTVAGTGERGLDRRGGDSGTDQEIASPWALLLGPDRETLYIAMAGTHQLWQTDLATGRTRAIAGSGRENVYDAPAMGAALAQPSGLALSTDGSRLYFTDTEGSAIRYLDLVEDRVVTVIGRAVENPSFDTSLFDFGDKDGIYPDARLQHAIGITLDPTPNGDRLIIADTYNDKLKVVNPDDRSVATWLGTAADQPQFEEPAGVFLTPRTSEAAPTLFVADTNKHRLLAIDPATEIATEITLVGLPAAGAAPSREPRPIPASAIATTLRLGSESIAATISIDLPTDRKLNYEFPAAYRVSRVNGERLGEVVAKRTIELGEGDQFPLPLEIPASDLQPGEELIIEFSYAACDDAYMLCVPGDAAWRITLSETGSTRLTAPHREP